MVRPLSRFAVFAACLILGAAGHAWAEPIAANSLSALRICLEESLKGADVECVISERVRTSTTGSSSLSTGVYSIVMPTNRKWNAVLRFADPEGCLEWNHAGSVEPTSSASAPVVILRVDVTASVPIGSKLRVIDPCIRELRNGVEGGAAATHVAGISFTGGGVERVGIAIENPRISRYSGGSSSAAITGVVSGPYASRLDACATGAIRGGGFNSLTGLYEWTCGNYPWSAEVGGIDAATGVSRYSSPTTVGGNSWTLLCTGDQTASNGEAREWTACRAAGERIRMYSSADMILAQDNTVHGGKVYNPPGLYHHGYCGQSSIGVANGCPVTRESPGIMTRKVASVNREFVNGGADVDYLENGRTGTWHIIDLGTDNGSGFAAATPDWANITSGGVGSTYNGGHWGLQAGPQDRWQYCKRSATSGGCIANASVSGLTGEAGPGLSASPLGRQGGTTTILADQVQWDIAGGQQPALCINDAIGAAAAGACSGDPRVECTNNGGSRTGVDTGDCASIGLGTCEGIYSSWSRIHNARGEADHSNLVVRLRGLGPYGSSTGSTATTQEVIVPVASDGFTGTVCATTGKLVRFGGPASADSRYMLGPFPVYLNSANPATLAFVPESRAQQTNSGWSDLTIVPQDFYGSASCSNGTQSGCDEVEAIAMGGGFGAFLRRAAIYKFGGVGLANYYGFSAVDGNPGCINCEVGWSLIEGAGGLSSDASGWWFHDNEWKSTNSATNTSALMAVSFSPDGLIERDRFSGHMGDSLFQFQNAPGLRIRDIVINNTVSQVGMIRLGGAQNVEIDGVTGYGNSGNVIMAEGAAGRTPATVTIRGMRLKSHSFFTSAYARAFFIRTNYGTSGFDSEYKGLFSVRDSSFQVHGDDNVCLTFWDGLTGNDTTADEGQGFVVDDDRNVFSFENVDLEVYDDGSKTGTQLPFCFGNIATSTANEPGDAGLVALPNVVGPLPSWRNLSIGSVDIPDNPFASVTSEAAGDCGALPHGTIVRVHDADVEGVCEDTDLDGLMDPESVNGVGLTAVCKCDPSGTGVWAPL